MKKETIIYNTYQLDGSHPEQQEHVIVGVYGTLKIGQGNYRRYLEGQSEFLGKALVRGLKMYSLGGFPGVKPGKRNDKVKMELFKIPVKKVLPRLDSLEGVPYMYSRFKASNNAGDDMYFYMYNGRISEKEQIESWS